MSNLGAQALSVVTGASINVSELALKGHAILSWVHSDLRILI